MSGWRIQVQEAVEAAQPELRVTGVEVAEGEDASGREWAAGPARPGAGE